MAVLEYGQEKKGQPGWPPLRLQLAGKMLLEDKSLAGMGKSHFYRPADLSYWREFQERLEVKYNGAVLDEVY